MSLVSALLFEVLINVPECLETATSETPRTPPATGLPRMKANLEQEGTRRINLRFNYAAGLKGSYLLTVLCKYAGLHRLSNGSLVHRKPASSHVQPNDAVQPKDATRELNPLLVQARHSPLQR